MRTMLLQQSFKIIDLAKAAKYSGEYSMKKMVIACLALLLLGCATQDVTTSQLLGLGEIKETKLLANGSNTPNNGIMLSITPTVVSGIGGECGSFIYFLGANWVSTTPDVVELTMINKPNGNMSKYVEFNVLQFSNGAEISSYSFKPTVFSEGATSSSTGIAIIPLVALKRILAGRDVIISVDSSRGEVNGNFSERKLCEGVKSKQFLTGLSTATEALDRFVKKIDAHK